MLHHCKCRFGSLTGSCGLDANVLRTKIIIIIFIITRGNIEERKSSPPYDIYVFKNILAFDKLGFNDVFFILFHSCEI